MEHLYRHSVAFSILDLVPISAGRTLSATVRGCRQTAQVAEELGYLRYWIAEHHNAAGYASSATTLLMSHAAEGTKRIRIGSGGMMLANHSLLHLAEQFGTLDCFYPNRIDLGLGRAAGADPLTSNLLLRDSSIPDLDTALARLQGFFAEPEPTQLIRAVPGAGRALPLFVLGSSADTARVAGSFGLPFAFAGHLRESGAREAFGAYRASFMPSSRLSRPHAILSINTVVASSFEVATELSSSWLLRLLANVRGKPQPLTSPVSNIDSFWTPNEASEVRSRMGLAVVGGPKQVRESIDNLIEDCAPNEIMLSTEVHDPVARLRSMAQFAEAVSHR